MPEVTETICPKCKVELRFTGKDTFSGREIREYVCEECREQYWTDSGTALWQALHDAANNDDAKE